MGYTHYFQQKTAVDDATWAKISEAIKALVDASPVTICNSYGKSGSEADFGPDYLAFNGEDNADDESHETFWLPKSHSDFNFCKTAYKPYDLIVTASLCAVDHFAPDAYDIASDGSEGEWQEGLEYARKTLNLPSLTVPSRVRD